MRVMRGSRQGEEEHREKQEWVGGKGPVLVYCTSHRQTDRQTAQGCQTQQLQLQSKKTPWENDAVIRTPLGWPRIPIID